MHDGKLELFFAEVSLFSRHVEWSRILCSQSTHSPSDKFETFDCPNKKSIRQDLKKDWKHRKVLGNV